MSPRRFGAVALFSALVAPDDRFMPHEHAGLLAGALPEYVICAAHLLFRSGILAQIPGRGRPRPPAGSMGFDVSFRRPGRSC